jgi:hypothetical protein
MYSVALYSEPLFCLLTFAGFYVLLMKNPDYPQDHETELPEITSAQLLASSFLFGLSITARSTGALTLLFPLLITLSKVFKKSDTFCKIYKYLVVFSLVLFIFALPYFMVMYWKPWELHCESKLDRTDQVTDWCLEEVPLNYRWV